MTQTSNRFLDEIARLMNDAAGVASGVRREVDTVFRNQADRILRELDVVKREEFEAVKDMARIAREENEALKARVAALGPNSRGEFAVPIICAASWCRNFNFKNRTRIIKLLVSFVFPTSEVPRERWQTSESGH